MKTIGTPSEVKGEFKSSNSQSQHPFYSKGYLPVDKHHQDNNFRIIFNICICSQGRIQDWGGGVQATPPPPIKKMALVD